MVPPSSVVSPESSASPSTKATTSEQALDRLLRRRSSKRCGLPGRALNRSLTICVELEKDANVASLQLGFQPVPKRIDGQWIVLVLVLGERLALPRDQSLGEVTDQA